MNAFPPHIRLLRKKQSTSPTEAKERTVGGMTAVSDKQLMNSLSHARVQRISERAYPK